MNNDEITVQVSSPRQSANSIEKELVPSTIFFCRDKYAIKIYSNGKHWFNRPLSHSVLRFETANNWFRLVSWVNGTNQISIFDVDLISSVPDFHFLTFLSRALAKKFPDVARERIQLTHFRASSLDYHPCAYSRHLGKGVSPMRMAVRGRPRKPDQRSILARAGLGDLVCVRWSHTQLFSTLAHRRIFHESSSLFIIVINLILMFSLWCIDCWEPLSEPNFYVFLY